MMDNINKRKVDLWEDDWEKEVQVSTRKRNPPNKAAVYTAILEQQHKDLSQTCNHLESKLTSLTNQLNEMQSSLLEEQAKLKDKQQQRQLKLTMSLVKITTDYMQRQNGCLGTLHENQQDLDKLLFQHQILSATLNQLEAHYISCLPSLDDEKKSKKLAGNGTLNDDERSRLALQMASLIAKHNRLEERYIDAKAKKEAYKAGTLVLEKEIKKINGLPQLIPILKSTTEQYQKEIIYQRQRRDKLPVSDMINHLGDLRIRFPLMASLNINRSRYLHHISSRLKKVYQGLLRQRSNQQVLTYSYEVEMKHLLSYKHALAAYRADLLKAPLEDETSSIDSEFDEQQQQAAFMVRVKQILASYQDKLRSKQHQEVLDPLTDYAHITDEQVVKTIKHLVDYETRWNKKWSEDINDNLDGIPLLDQAKQDLTTTLFGGAVSRQAPEIKPRDYDDLQWTVNTMTSDIRTEADQLEKQAQASDQVFKDRRTFVSLFFTDPFTFESKMDDYLDSLPPRNSIFESLY